MARWKLVTEHYLNVPGTEWEYKETSRETGRQVRRVFPVPLHLDPNENNIADHNYPGEIIVCHVGKGQGRDIEFVGPPTPDMQPLDDEAKAISAKLPQRNQDALYMNSYADGILEGFLKQIANLQSNQVPQQLYQVSAGHGRSNEFA